MFFIALLRWIRGYARVRVSQGSAGKLMTVCARNGILLWNGTQEKDAFCGCVAQRMLEGLLALTKQTGIDLRVDGFGGLPHLIDLYRRRIGIVVGCILFLTVLIVSQQFIWKVEVEGYKNADPQRLIMLLDELGVHRGTPKKQIDLEYTAREMLRLADELSWTTLNLHGTTAILRIRERMPPPPKIDTNVPANVVATEDGQIKRLQVTDGRAVLEEGDTVRKGEVIVSGVWQDRWGLTHFVRAGGHVYAHVPRDLTVKVPLQQEFCAIHRVERRSYFEIFGWRLPLFFYREPEGDCKVERYSETPELFGVTMPFSIGRENMLYYEKQAEDISQEQALAIARRKLAFLERQSFAGDPVISREVSASAEKGVLTLRGVYEIEMDIAAQKEIGVIEYSTPEEKKKIPKEAGY